MIEVKGVSKHYGSRKAVQDLTFSIDKGEVIGLLGLNGAGKSTILKILGSYLLPSQGVARVGGYCVETQADEVRKLIGFLPDVPPLYNEMIVEKFLRFVAGLKGVQKTQIDRAVSLAMEKVSLHNVADVTLGTLSHGYRQRVGIAQALVHNPEVLILDEPILGLDPIQIVEMRDLIVSLKGLHTVILSSHILSEITRTCDRILVLDQGCLVAEGSERQLSENIVNQTKIMLIWQGSEAVLHKIRAVPEVIQLEDVREGQIFTVTITAGSDIRARLADVIVSSGGNLLELKKVEMGLESLFLKLVKAR